MPSSRHEIPILLFRDHPEAIPRLLHEALGLEIPPHARVEIASATFTQVTPAEYRADLVVKLANDKPVLGIILEFQLKAERRKRFTWPLYSAALHAQLECKTCLVVIAPTPSIAAWASEPIDTLQPGSPFTPLVLGPDRMPWVTSAEEAAAVPEIAVLSAMAHINEPGGLEVAVVALHAVGRLDPERATLYSDLVYFAATNATRKLLDSKMNLSNYEYQSEFVKKFVAQGESERAVKAIFTVLRTRGIPVSDDVRARIEGCHDVDTLDVWLARAVTAASAADVVAE